MNKLQFNPKDIISCRFGNRVDRNERFLDVEIIQIFHDKNDTVVYIVDNKIESTLAVAVKSDHMINGFIVSDRDVYPYTPDTKNQVKCDIFKTLHKK